MNDIGTSHGGLDEHDSGPGDSPVLKHVGSYVLGLALATLLTVASFWLAGTNFLYGPSLPVALLVLAVAQIGIHLVFFLHITTAPDNTNNIMALAFGVLIVFLVVIGSVWIMDHLNGRMMPMEMPMPMPAPGGAPTPR